MDTVNVYSIPVVPMTDYTRSGLSRYGNPTELGRNVQTMKITRDRAATFTIDKGNKIQSMMVADAGKALRREIDEVWIPEYDAYVIQTLAAKATERGNMIEMAASDAATKSLDSVMAALEHMGNRSVPDDGRVLFASYAFANGLMRDPNFVKDSDRAQDMLLRGTIGTVEGTRIVRVPSGLCPTGFNFLLTHPVACVAPKQLEEYRIHDNPPGINGWLCEFRAIYDCFVLNNKADAIFYCGGAGVLKSILVQTVACSADGKKSQIVITTPAEAGHTYKYKTGTAAAKVSYGDDTSSGWTAISSNGEEITPTSSHTILQVVECDSAGKAVGLGTTVINK